MSVLRNLNVVSYINGLNPRDFCETPNWLVLNSIGCQDTKLLTFSTSIVWNGEGGVMYVEGFNLDTFDSISDGKLVLEGDSSQVL